MSESALSQQDLRVYRMWLQAMVTRLSDGVAKLTAEVRRPAGIETTATASTEEDEENARSVLLSEEKLLAEAQDALARLDAGTFGRCERCGEAIPRVRLDAAPYARHCIRCAQVAEGRSN